MMEDFDNLQTSIFGQPLSITAKGVLSATKLSVSEVKIVLEFQGLKSTILPNVPASLSRKDIVVFSAEQIRKELEIIEGLFLEKYTAALTRMELLERVFRAYRELGSVLNITTSKHKQDVTNGNS